MKYENPEEAHIARILEKNIEKGFKVLSRK